MKAWQLGLLLTLWPASLACNPGSTDIEPALEPSPSALGRFELRPVVSDELERLRRELALGATKAQELANPDRVLGLLSLLSGHDGRMRSLAREEAAGLQQSCEAQLGMILADAEEPRELRMAAAEMLALVGGDAAAEVLLLQLESAEDAWQRTQAAWRLGELKLDWVIPRIVLRLKYEKDFETVIWMAKSLAILGNYEGLLALQAVADAAADEALIQSAYQQMQLIAKTAQYADVESLWDAWTNGPPFTPLPPGLPEERSPRYQLEVWQLIQRFVEFQLRGVDDSRFVLQRLGSEAARIMGAALHDSNGYIRVGVGQSLQRMGPRARPAAETLVLGLSDRDLGPWAALALGAIGPRAFAPGQAALVARLGPGEDPELRLSCIRALAGFGDQPDPGALAALDELCASGTGASNPPARSAVTEEFRQAACESLLALGKTGGVVEALLDWMTSKTVSTASSQRALRAWLERQRQLPGFAEVLVAWDALRLPDQKVVSGEEREGVKRAQAELLRAALPGLLAALEAQELRAAAD